MISTKELARVAAAARDAGAKLILAGDDKQLSSIERGGMFETLRQTHGAATLKEVQRVRDAEQKEAFGKMHEGEFLQALKTFDQKGGIHWTDRQSDTLKDMAARYTADVAATPDKRRFMFAYTNKDVASLNQHARALHRQRGDLGQDHSLATKHGAAQFATGDRIQFTGNGRTKAEKNAGLTNGRVGTVTALAIDEHGKARVSVELDAAKGDKPQTVSFVVGENSKAGEFNSFKHGFAGTIYRGQGRTLDEAYVAHSAQWRSAASYVALTRHRERVHIFAARETVKDLETWPKGMARTDNKRAATAYSIDPHSAARAELDRAEAKAVSAKAFVVDVVKGLETAKRVEEESIVLLKNDHAILPIDPSRVHSIAIIGGHADVGMISGGGSAQVDAPGGNAISPQVKGRVHWHEQVWFPTSPLKALQAKLPNTKIDFDPGTDPQAAATLARNSDLAIVFAYQWESEGIDLPSLALSGNQNALIEQVAAANPHTIVVVESGTAVTMPWIDKVAGVVEAWYAGSSGHKALAGVLGGEVNPSGKLPITFPIDESDLPHPVIPSAPPRDPALEKDHAAPLPTNYAVDYDEGVEAGYKWFEAEHKQPLFPFGFGLSYTSYEYSGLSVDSAAGTVRFTVTNTGKRAGTEIAEVYARLPQGADESSYKRLVGWKRISLAAGASETVVIPIDSRILATFDEAHDNWSFAPGDYGVYVGGSSDSTPLTGILQVR